MLNHPKNAQVIIDQRWKELQASADPYEQARAALPPKASVPSWLQCRASRLALLRRSLAGSRPTSSSLRAAVMLRGRSSTRQIHHP
jgi:hypothetical protein